MICMNCSSKKYCYAADDTRIECDDFAKSLKNEQKIYWDRIKCLDVLKLTAESKELEKVLQEISQLEDFICYSCQDLANGPRIETEEDPF